MQFDTLKDWVKASWKAQAEWREEAAEDYAFKDGHQWSDSEMAEMESNSRIPIVFNRTAVIIGSVAGSEVNNRTEVRFIPREIGDSKPNEILTAGGEWFRDQGDAEDADSEAFEDLLVCGVGFTDTGLDFEADPEGAPDIKRMDPLCIGWDHHAHRKGLRDSRYFFEVREMPISEAEERFPGHRIEDIHADWINKKDDDENPHENKVGDQYRADNEVGEFEGDTVTVVRIQYRQRVKTVEYVDPQTGQKAEMPADRWKRFEGFDIPHRTRTEWKWKQAFLGQDEVLDENEPNPDGSTINAMTGHWDRKKKRFYGLLRSIKDPQKFANKWLSQVLHIIGSNSKGGIMVERGATEDERELEESWSAADGVTWLENGAISGGRIMEKPKADMPAALMGLTEFAIQSIRDVSGVNMEMLGLRDANQPGVLEYQRRQSAMTTMAKFFDSLRFYRKQQGDTILHFLRNHIAPTGRLVRIVREDQTEYIPLAMSDDARKYDVIVDDAPQAPNEKEKAWSVIEAMLPLLQQAGLSLDDWADIMEYSPLPSAFVDKVRSKAEEMKKKGPSPQEQMAEAGAQAELQLKQAQAAKTQAEAQAVGQELPLRQAEMQMEGQQMQAEGALTQQELRLEAEKLSVEREKLANERIKIAADARRITQEGFSPA